MKKVLLIVLAAFALALPAAATSKPVGNATCGGCIDQNPPPWPCDYWHNWGATLYYQGYWWFCGPPTGHWVLSQ